MGALLKCSDAAQTEIQLYRNIYVGMFKLNDIPKHTGMVREHDGRWKVTFFVPSPLFTSSRFVSVLWFSSFKRISAEFWSISFAPVEHTQNTKSSMLKRLKVLINSKKFYLLTWHLFDVSFFSLEKSSAWLHHMKQQKIYYSLKVTSNFR